MPTAAAAAPRICRTLDVTLTRSRWPRCPHPGPAESTGGARLPKCSGARRAGRGGAKAAAQPMGAARGGAGRGGGASAAAR